MWLCPCQQYTSTEDFIHSLHIHPGLSQLSIVEKDLRASTWMASPLPSSTNLVLAFFFILKQGCLNARLWEKEFLERPDIVLSYPSWLWTHFSSLDCLSLSAVRMASLYPHLDGSLVLLLCCWEPRTLSWILASPSLFLFLVFWGRISYNSRWPWTPDPPSSAFWVLDDVCTCCPQCLLRMHL